MGSTRLEPSSGLWTGGLLSAEDLVSQQPSWLVEVLSPPTDMARLILLARVS